MAALCEQLGLTVTQGSERAKFSIRGESSQVDALIARQGLPSLRVLPGEFAHLGVESVTDCLHLAGADRAGPRRSANSRGTLRADGHF